MCKRARTTGDDPRRCWLAAAPACVSADRSLPCSAPVSTIMLRCCQCTTTIHFGGCVCAIRHMAALSRSAPCAYTHTHTQLSARVHQKQRRPSLLLLLAAAACARALAHELVQRAHTRAHANVCTVAHRRLRARTHSILMRFVRADGALCATIKAECKLLPLPSRK